MDDRVETETYDAMDHSEPNAAFVDRLIELGATGTMLDLGTGNGLIPIELCRRLPDVHVLGVDLSENMLQLARDRIAAAGLNDRITLQIADARFLPFTDGQFDAVFSNTILHHLVDPGPFLAETVRVLRPDGVLLIRDLFRPHDEATVERLVAEHAGAETVYAQQLLRQSLKAALTPGELRELVSELDANAFEVVVDTDRHVSIQGRKRA